MDNLWITLQPVDSLWITYTWGEGLSSVSNSEWRIEAWERNTTTEGGSSRGDVVVELVWEMREGDFVREKLLAPDHERDVT